MDERIRQVYLNFLGKPFIIVQYNKETDDWETITPTEFFRRTVEDLKNDKYKC